MFNFLKSDKNEAASRKSFDKMQQLLFDADSYMKAGHKDVAKALLHELVKEAERNTDKIAEEIYSVPPGECFFQDVDLCKGCKNGCEAEQKSQYTAPLHPFDFIPQQTREFTDLDREVMEVEFEEPEPGRQVPAEIQAGNCISDRGTDHCGFCVDRCEAKDHKPTATNG